MDQSTEPEKLSGNKPHAKKPTLEELKDFEADLQALPDDYTFGDWLQSTRLLQEVAYGAFYDQLDDETRADSMMMNLNAAHHELCELGDETGWKPWVKPRGWIRREAVMMEAVDLLHFVGNLLTHAQATGEEFTKLYREKQLKNLRRQIEGYDGISDKCARPGCGRELPKDPWRKLGSQDKYCSQECAR